MSVKVITKIDEMKSITKAQSSMGRSVGFVPTMGFLHEGHLSLVRESLKKSDCTVVSIFVNPTQFGPEEDFQEYPRDLDKDTALLESLGVDYVFVPDDREMYPEGFETYVEVTNLQKKLEGRSRPEHFRGVCTIVLKLFSVVQPHVAYFGQKDAQQAAIIKKMVRDLSLDVDIQVLPIVREFDGLALSSRNIYLTKDQRRAALCLVESLRKGKDLIESGEQEPLVVKKEMKRIIDAESSVTLDYIAIVDLDKFEDLNTINRKALIALAAYVGGVRLIDNMIIHGKE